MSWDIVLFNSREKITLVEELDPDQLEPTDFWSAFDDHFEEIEKSDGHWDIQGKDFSIVCYPRDEMVSNTTVNLYGINGLYELIFLAKKHGWQIFDTGRGEMLDLENPAKNGFENFQSYIRQILRS